LNPFERIEQPNDPSLYYPDLPDTVPVWALLVFGVGVCPRSTLHARLDYRMMTMGAIDINQCL